MKYHKGMKKYQVLELAKELLPRNAEEYNSDGNSPYICHCIGRVTKGEICNAEDDPSGLIKLIEERLYPYSAYGRWLEGIMGIDIYKEPNWKDKIQLSRHNWLLHLITEFKNLDE